MASATASGGGGSWEGGPTVSTELFSLTHGAIVRQILSDCGGDPEAANASLLELGRHIGERLVDDFLATALVEGGNSAGRCSSFREAAEAVARQGFRYYLGVTAQIVPPNNPDATELSIQMDDLPLADYVQLPEDLQSLSYCNIICGVISGALEQLGMKVECSFTKDALQSGDNGQGFEIQLRLIEMMVEEYPFKED